MRVQRGLISAGGAERERVRTLLAASARGYGVNASTFGAIFDGRARERGALEVGVQAQSRRTLGLDELRNVAGSRGALSSFQGRRVVAVEDEPRKGLGILASGGKEVEVARSQRRASKTRRRSHAVVRRGGRRGWVEESSAE